MDPVSILRLPSFVKGFLFFTVAMTDNASEALSIPPFCFNSTTTLPPHWEQSKVRGFNLFRLFTVSHSVYLKAIVFWIEGVSLCICGNIGIIGEDECKQKFAPDVLLLHVLVALIKVFAFFS
jgi:hypothetical protein